MLLLKIFPFIILSDVAKSSIVSSLTHEIESIGKQVKNVSLLKNYFMVSQVLEIIRSAQTFICV
jgi:hypothetical protein